MSHVTARKNDHTEQIKTYFLMYYRLQLSLKDSLRKTVRRYNKKSPANAKGNEQQRCMCEGPVRTKSKFTKMFHLDLTADDA